MIDFQPVRGRAQAPSLVEQVVQAFSSAIARQVLRPGMPVPSVREFARQHGISTFTVASAYSRLAAQGWLVARPGSGYRAASPQAAAPRAGTPGQWSPPRLNDSWLLSDIYADHSIPIKSGCGWLPPEWLHEEGLHQALRHLGRVPALRIAGYGHPYGYAPLRETIAAGLGAAGMPAEADQVLLTQGVTHGLDLVMRTLLRPGDTVLVEQPCYANLLQLLRLVGMRVVSVPRGVDGIDCEALDAAALAHRPRALFVNTVLQNPSGASLGMANAFRVLQAAERHGLWIVEDDISRELMPAIAPLLAALDGAQRVVYLSGYSKAISPSVRVGYIVAHRDLVRDLARTKMAAGLTSPEIMERVVHQVIREGRYRAHVLRTRERLGQAHAQVVQAMDEHGLQLCARPQAGLFLWARPGGAWRERGANALAELALKDGIWLAPGSYFDAADADIPWLRFNVAYSDAAALWRFLRGAGASAQPATRSYSTKS
ncbi:GntR family transcriptional regulator [Bordetella pertussis]|uniref:2-aminoadipate transaminase n=32 Tax=Bordetella pertussis TaxID=520 RepID=A0A381A7D2_BORPT|nr:PLP-dependent aminotransferase family protein [Bordetella pertussis]ETH38258.1 transcriptional regulator, GntR family [Bordetella pertussis H918]ETH45405.1 transcriptional regulator, GntR family [Bordetella pertussis H939]ETH45867.1 transcriptional regulator, GntR family [Bordetella pertussis H921]ETH70351.1 transcriptional regulator, GntR family [Bordetella pertussis STO1-CHLA-0011]ETH81678.1 transcriptional regulator, GntR family [Bordetella pertussis STO1-CHOC-0017]ETH85973.1 transcript